MKLLLCFSGSVASIKAMPLIEQLNRVEGLELRVIVTEAACHFIDFDNAALQRVSVFRDKDEWSGWSGIGDQVLHIELRKWADAMLIAPLSANTLAKISNGQCDNLLTCVVRAWDYERPLLLAPAMNTLMWSHVFTEQQLDRMTSLGATVVPPVAKTLACGDVGVGAMASVDTLVQVVRELCAAQPVQ
eukprot:TRINITY_DN1043_c0_g1_i1.p1 TRINITY_DN1043_c0_g1~~TRINITY_DN1043_c0_g1_i1.p1  ORF type:complete len:188 (-),score=48.67 TRINITY_DN1043_c0_g1_i1:135-698(-)